MPLIKNNDKNNSSKDILSSIDFEKAVLTNDTALLNQKYYSSTQINCLITDDRAGYCRLPLNIAISRGYYDLVKGMLLEIGNDFYVNYGELLFSLVATPCEDFELFKIICDRCKKRDINKKDTQGKTLLHYAAANSPLKFVRYLLDAGAVDSINVADSQWWTPINLAFENKDVEVLKLLITHPKFNADLFGRDGINSYIAFSMTRRLKAYAAVEFLLKQFPQFINLDMLFVAIAERIPLHLIELMLSHKEVEESMIKDSGESREAGTALNYAVMYNDLPLVELLIEHHANINSKTSDGKTLLHTALYENASNDLIDILIKKRASWPSLDDVDQAGKTVFQLAGEKNRIEVLEKLLKYRVDVENDPLKKQMDVLQHQALQAQAANELNKLKIEMLAKINELNNKVAELSKGQQMLLRDLNQKNLMIQELQNKITQLTQQLNMNSKNNSKNDDASEIENTRHNIFFKPASLRGS